MEQYYINGFSEKGLRVKISLWAYAYAIGKPIVPDEKYDRRCREINLEVTTGNENFDTFFKINFHTNSYRWIYQHPDLSGIEGLYRKVMKDDDFIPL